MFKILDESCTPTRDTKYSAAIDLRSREDVVIGAGETALVPLGIKIDFESIKKEYISDEYGKYDIAMKSYPKQFQEWVSGLEDKNDYFEFELYDGKVVDFNSIPNEEYQQELVEYYKVEYFGSRLKDFIRKHYLQLMLRSGLGKKGLILPNGVGIIDLDCQDEIMMIVHNPVKIKTCFNIADFSHKIRERFVSSEHYEVQLLNEQIRENNYTINKGDRVGQIMLLEHKSFMFGIESDAVRSGGFGSTGIN
jgi:dUTPase